MQNQDADPGVGAPLVGALVVQPTKITFVNARLSSGTARPQGTHKGCPYTGLRAPPAIALAPSTRGSICYFRDSGCHSSGLRQTARLLRVLSDDSPNLVAGDRLMFE